MSRKHDDLKTEQFLVDPIDPIRSDSDPILIRSDPIR